MTAEEVYNAWLSGPFGEGKYYHCVIHSSRLVLINIFHIACLIATKTTKFEHVVDMSTCGFVIMSNLLYLLYNCCMPQNGVHHVSNMTFVPFGVDKGQDVVEFH